MIPIVTKDGLIKKKIARALGSALWMYDLTGGWRIGKFHRRLNAKAAYKHLPTMPKDRLASAYLYYDAAADDSRICISLAQTAAQLGATLANWCSVTGIEKDSSGTFLVQVQSHEGDALTVKSKAVVNATGVWADDVRKLDEGKHPSSIRPAKGVHITVPWNLVRNDIAVVIPVPKDKRSLFVVPWVPNGDGTFQYTYIGTTDTGYDGSPDNPQCTKDDIDYVLRALNASITNEITHKDVLAVWAGLRPLVKPDENESIGERTADLSRRHRVSTSASGVITVTGGKLTTYREMSEDTIDAVIHQLHLSDKKYRCQTKNLSLHGARGYKESKSLTTQQLHLAQRFGTFATDIEALITAQPDLAQPLIDGLPYLRAEAMYAVTHEMAFTLDDVLSRRTRALLLNRTAAKNAARSVAELIAPQMNWSESDINNQVAHFHGICAEEESAGLVTESEFVASTKEQP